MDRQTELEFLHESEGDDMFGPVCFFSSLHVSVLQVVILDVRVPCTPVARLNNHRACVNGIAWAPHSSCHICTAGKHT